MKRAVVVFIWSILLLVTLSSSSIAEEETIKATVIWLNPVLREEPYVEAEAICELPCGEEVHVMVSETLEPIHENGYVHVYSEEGEGWLNEEAISYSMEFIIVGGDEVGIYEGENRRHRLADSLPQGTRMVVLDTTESGYFVSFLGAAGFIPATENVYLELLNEILRTLCDVRTVTVTKNCSAYAFQNQESAVIKEFDKGEQVEVFSAKTQENWLVVDVDGRYAYIREEVVE